MIYSKILMIKAHYLSSLLSIDMHTKYSNNSTILDLLDKTTHNVLKDLDEAKSFFDYGEQEVQS